LCLIDTEDELYIWQGFRDMPTDELEIQLFNAGLQAGGTADMRFTAERRCTCKTAINYWEAKTGEIPDTHGYVVYAGLEPIEFTNLFPKWTINLQAKQQNLL
ncbi:unnamed protein product, partial [Didymodactylos carnosus]